MKFTILRTCTLGKSGAVCSIKDRRMAHMLETLGYVAPYVEPEPPPKPKRTYRRKDVVAEPAQEPETVVVVAEVPEPEPEPEPKPKRTYTRKKQEVTDDVDETSVRL